MRYNPPPNWPVPPPGWQPPPGWKPDPQWGPLPNGWHLWVDDSIHVLKAPASRPVAGMLKHPIWISVGTVVGVLALLLSAVAYMQSSPSEGQLSIAAVSMGEPVDLAAVGIEPAMMSEYAVDDVAAAPIDVTIKNDGGAAVSIDRVSATVIQSEFIQSCLRQGAGGVSVAAEYALSIPPDQLTGDGRGTPVSNDVEFRVNPGENGRFVVTVGPQQQAENVALVIALQLTFDLTDGTTLETDPVVIGTTQKIVEQLVSQVEDASPGDPDVARLCQRELEKIDDVVGDSTVRSDSVDQLRDAYAGVA